MAALTLLEAPVLTLFLGEGSPSLPIAEPIGAVATLGVLAFGVSLVLFGRVRANGTVTDPLVILLVAVWPAPAERAHL